MRRCTTTLDRTLRLDTHAQKLARIAAERQTGRSPPFLRNSWSPLTASPCSGWLHPKCGPSHARDSTAGHLLRPSPHSGWPVRRRAARHTEPRSAHQSAWTAPRPQFGTAGPAQPAQTGDLPVMAAGEIRMRTRGREAPRPLTWLSSGAPIWRWREVRIRSSSGRGACQTAPGTASCAPRQSFGTSSRLRWTAPSQSSL